MTYLLCKHEDMNLDPQNLYNIQVQKYTCTSSTKEAKKGGWLELTGPFRLAKLWVSVSVRKPVSKIRWRPIRGRLPVLTSTLFSVHAYKHAHVHTPHKHVHSTHSQMRYAENSVVELGNRVWIAVSRYIDLNGGAFLAARVCLVHPVCKEEG